MHGTTQLSALSVRLLSVIRNTLTFIYALACVRNSLLLLLSSTSCMIYHDLFILSPVGHLDWFQSISNKSAMNIHVQVSIRIYTFISLGWIKLYLTLKGTFSFYISVLIFLCFHFFTNILSWIVYTYISVYVICFIHMHTHTHTHTYISYFKPFSRKSV